MARISGVDLPREKRVEIGLTYIYGIGRSMSNKILKNAGVNPDTRVKDLSEQELAAIRDEIAEIHVEGDLRRDVAMNLKRLREINCYRGVRHKKRTTRPRTENQNQRKNQKRSGIQQKSR